MAYLAAVRAMCGEWLERAHTGPVDFVLRALAARKLLQQRKFLSRCAAGKPVIHANCSGNERLEDQVTDKS
jgi:hypothetical protein